MLANSLLIRSFLDPETYSEYCKGNIDCYYLLIIYVFYFWMYLKILTLKLGPLFKFVLINGN